MVLIPTHKIVIFETVTDAEKCGTDSYDLPKTCKVEVATVEGSYQPNDPSSSWYEFGRVVRGFGDLFLDLDAPINSDSQLKIYELETGEEVPGLFYVYGHPQKTTLIPNLQCKVAQEYLNG